jgi:Double zinc ribbon
MTMLWNRRTSGSAEPTASGEGESLKMIPLWASVLAIVVFVGWMVFMNRPPSISSPVTSQPASASPRPAPNVPGPRHRRSPLEQATHLAFVFTTGTALASYILLVGYVSRDVKRRAMSAPLWMLIVLVMPGGMGAVVYFLLRQPILIRCPHCTTELPEGVHFCPQCRFQMAPVCGQCFRSVQITDAYCPQCGHDVAEDLAPARLRAYSDT